MGEHYDQLSLEERLETWRLRSGGWSFRRIAARLGRSASTISREWRRNSRDTKAWHGGYQPVRAQQLAARRRRWDARFKLARQPALRAVVRERLAMGYSPEQVAGRLALEQGRTVISHESIYRYIDHLSRQDDPRWHRLLPQRKHRRGWRGKRGGSPVDHIKERVSIHERPDAVADRRQAGHWEADLMLFARYGQAVLVTHERHSRYTELRRQPNKAAAPVLRTLSRQFRALPSALCRSITFDNGTEFVLHHRLRDRLGIKTYFCDPRSPWQKGGVENAIQRLRRSMPRKTDLTKITPRQLTAVVERYNNTPRKCLGFKTPTEVFQSLRSNDALQV